MGAYCGFTPRPTEAKARDNLQKEQAERVDERQDHQADGDGQPEEALVDPVHPFDRKLREVLVLEARE